jgi:hypothetical protein
MPEIDVSVSLHGPFFHGSPPAMVMAETLNGAVRELVNEGEKAVDAQLYPGHGLVTGHYKRSVHGEMTGTLHGRIHDSGVVYGPWLEGVGTRNATSRFKGYAMFRNARQKLEGMKLDIVRKWAKKAADKWR